MKSLSKPKLSWVIKKAGDSSQVFATTRKNYWIVLFCVFSISDVFEVGTPTARTRRNAPAKN